MTIAEGDDVVDVLSGLLDGRDGDIRCHVSNDEEHGRDDLTLILSRPRHWHLGRQDLDSTAPSTLVVPQ